MLEKNEIRRQIKSAKQNLTEAEIARKSSLILQQLRNHLVLSENQAVHIYEALDTLKEPLTQPIIKHLESSYPTMSIYMPIANQAHKSRMVTSANVVSFNTQVFPTVREMQPNNEINVFLLPLVAFDVSGNRLGHGGGFYDKLLSHFQGAKKIGLAFELQKVDSIPAQAHDIKLDEVITESQIYRC